MTNTNSLSLAAVLAAFCLWQATVSAQAFEPEVPTTRTLETTAGQENFWVFGPRMPNETDGRGFLFDREGQHLGQISGGLWFTSLLFANKRREIVGVETYFSRGTRGVRDDIVVLYDPNTLSPVREIDIPDKRLQAVKSSGVARLSDDERFAYIANYTPAQSVSIVDLENGLFTEEVETPGCSVIYPAGNRDFYSICGNGGFFHVRIDETGKVTLKERSPRLFDPVKDFLTVDASRIGDTWYFVSQQNNVYPVLMTPDDIELGEVWSLVSKRERSRDWRISGMDNTAAHGPSGELYVLMHRGPPESFEEPGTHVWVYNAKDGKKLREIELEDLSFSLAVSQTDAPRLFTIDLYIPHSIFYYAWIVLVAGEEAVMQQAMQRANIYDARTGRHLSSTEVLPQGFVTGIEVW